MKTITDYNSVSNETMLKLARDNKVITIRDRNCNKIGLIVKDVDKCHSENNLDSFAIRFKLNDRENKADVETDALIFIVDSLRHLQACHLTCDTM